MLQHLDYDPHVAAAELDAVEVVQNRLVTSVGEIVRPEVPEKDGNAFQVDRIKMESKAFDFAIGYFGHGDTGNLLGRLYPSCGLALRHDGLAATQLSSKSGPVKAALVVA